MVALGGDTKDTAGQVLAQELLRPQMVVAHCLVFGCSLAAGVEAWRLLL